MEDMALGELAQHVAVFLVALGALVVLVRRVAGVFEARPPSHPAANGAPLHTGGTACNHCAAGTAAASTAARRQGSPH